VLSKQLVAFRAGAAVASVLPVPVVCSLGRGIGALAGWLPDYDGKRALVASHMARVLGRPLGALEARRMVGEVFANYGRYWAESLRLPSLSRAAVAAGMTVAGQEHVDAALANGRGVVVAPPHLGGWEWGAGYLTGSGLQVTVVVEVLEPPELFEWFAAFRERLGMHVIPAGPGAASAVLRALKDNHVVCLLSDRLVGNVAGVEVDFFGERAMMPAGPVTLAVRSGAPVVPAAIYFGKQASSHNLVFRPPLPLGTGGRLRQVVEEGTQALAHELEQLVRRAPVQWHLLQPNWPSDAELHSGSTSTSARAGTGAGRGAGASADGGAGVR
jgi:KDO2-lipid IV(A) lauroyltransferase